ncbi:MAG: helix-turn-helix transcriptional regulator [Candidatus Algichlamydia australiensis]|nr:helix-turn-helix transcriptional regulator [Chlamydiales bacterium]
MDDRFNEVTISSGNVFADLGIPNPEEALVKAELASQIDDIMRAENITQKEAAIILGIDQPKVSDIVNGKLRHYSIDRLMRFLRRLGKDIEIHVISKAKRRSSTSIKVKASKAKKSSVRKRRRPQAK